MDFLALERAIQKCRKHYFSNNCIEILRQCIYYIDINEQLMLYLNALLIPSKGVSSLKIITLFFLFNKYKFRPVSEYDRLIS